MKELNERYLFKKYSFSNIRMSLNIEAEMKLEFILEK
jgi:hypothetical protein